MNPQSHLLLRSPLTRAAGMEELPPNKALRFSPPTLLLVVLLLLLFLQQSAAMGAVVGSLPCEGRSGGCLLEHGMEVEMSSEESRRMLWAVSDKKYISYEALKGDVVPCSKPGVPYYNCHTFPRAGPYNRGCQIISGCRGDSP